MSIQDCSEPTCQAGKREVALVIESKAKDLGDFEVRRVLPAAQRQRVGPFIFFDHMGPATFAPGKGVAVRPHPHIGLSTVTFLFEGVIRHRDSLGSDQAITPGAVNWMTAGRGIVHSERTPSELLESGSRLHGLQVWLAHPEDKEEVEPSFVHHPAASLAQVKRPGVSLTLIAGAAFGEVSAVETVSPALYLAGTLSANATLEFPCDYEERAVYVLEGEVEIDGIAMHPGTMAVLNPDVVPELTATRESRVALIGGAPLAGERHLWWNFVSSSKARLEQAKADWKQGRFDVVPGDPEFIPLPE